MNNNNFAGDPVIIEKMSTEDQPNNNFAGETLSQECPLCDGTLINNKCSKMPVNKTGCTNYYGHCIESQQNHEGDCRGR